MSDIATLDHLVDAISEAMPPLSARQLDLVLSAYRAMLAGMPAEVTAIAAEADWPADQATTAGRSWAWCALDPLFILPLVNERGTVAARSGVTGKPVELQVTPDGVTPIGAGGD